MNSLPLYDFKIADTVWHLHKPQLGEGFIYNKSFDNFLVEWEDGTKSWVLSSNLRPATLSKKYQPSSSGVLMR